MPYHLPKGARGPSTGLGGGRFISCDRRDGPLEKGPPGSELVDQPRPGFVKPLVLALVEDLAVRQVNIAEFARPAVVEVVAQGQLGVEQHLRTEIDAGVVELGAAGAFLIADVPSIGRR